MKTPTRPASPLRLYCYIFGHNYKVTKHVTKHVKEYTCTCCKHQVTTNSNGKLTELTPKYRDINSTLAKIYSHKMMRLQQQSLGTVNI